MGSPSKRARRNAEATNGEDDAHASGIGIVVNEPGTAECVLEFGYQHSLDPLISPSAAKTGSERSARPTIQAPVDLQNLPTRNADNTSRNNTRHERQELIASAERIAIDEVELRTSLRSLLKKLACSSRHHMDSASSAHDSRKVLAQQPHGGWPVLDQVEFLGAAAPIARADSDAGKGIQGPLEATDLGEERVAPAFLESGNIKVWGRLIRKAVESSTQYAANHDAQIRGLSGGRPGACSTRYR
jgi:hypothetical protein